MTTTMTPALAQRLGALQRANEVRTTRARIKRDLKGGRRSIVSLLRHPPAEISTMKVFDLLLAVPKFGRVKVNKVLVRARVAPSKTIGGMTARQRSELLRLLPGPDERAVRLQASRNRAAA